MSDYRGRFLWYELMTTDVDAAKGFYGEVVGWGTQEWEGSEPPYTMFNVGEAPVAGLMTLPDEAAQMGAPPHWLAYVGTPDVDATIAKAKELGASVLHGPEEMPEVGKFAVLRDPQGAVFAAYTPSEPPESATEAQGPGHFSWHELAAGDHGEAYAFYNALFGWTKTSAMEMGEMGTYQMYGRREDTSLGGMFDKSPEMEGPPFWLYYVSVPDVGAALERVKARGGQVLSGPMEVPGGDIVATCCDPQGAAFALHASAPEPD